MGVIHSHTGFNKLRYLRIPSSTHQDIILLILALHQQGVLLQGILLQGIIHLVHTDLGILRPGMPHHTATME